MVLKQRGYNFRDLLWKIAPRRVQNSCVSDLTEDNAHSPKNVFCSQAVILALREAFSGVDTKPHLKAFTKSMNSRITTPTQLERCFVTHQHKEVNTGMVPLTFWDAREEYLRSPPYGFSRDEFPNLIELKVDIHTW